MSALDQLARAGIQAMNERRYADAIQEFRAALALGPDRPDLNNALGMAYLNQGQVGDALDHLRRAVELAKPYDAPEHQQMRVHFHLGLANAHELGDDLVGARAVLEDAIAEWPDAVEPRLQLGQLLFASCRVEDGLDVYRELAELESFDAGGRDAARVVVEAVTAFLDSDMEADTFLLGHCESYRDWFDGVASEQEKVGWFAEAARMARSADGEPAAFLPEGARPYAFLRVDLVNPETGETANIYDGAEPMIVALSGLEPLAQVPVLFAWPGRAFEVWVSTQVPWHWLPLTIELRDVAAPAEVERRIDDVVGAWYLAGYNGEFGERDKGRFHFVSDPQPVGDRALSYVVDLGRADFRAIEDLLARLTVLHDRHPVQRVLFGRGHLPD